MSSRILHLEDSEGRWQTSKNSTPSIINLQGVGAFRSISLPNASLCADFLVCRESNEWVGIAVAVVDADAESINSMIRSADPARCRLLRKPGPTYQVYADFPDQNWLEIRWSNKAPDRMIEVQTCGVLWYIATDDEDGIARLNLMILEDVDSLVAESGEDLQLTSDFFGPDVKIVHFE